MDLESYFEQFQNTFMPEDFVWRKGQKEAIIIIIQTYFEKKYDTVILDAPVGSGKSIVGMCAAWILNQKGKDGYVLSSDIALQDQYEGDLNKFNFSWGSVKGLDNYTCVDNLEKVSLGTCKIQRKEARKMYCYEECPYYSARNKASSSQTSMLNYAYWLTMMNEVNSKMEKEKQIFPMRDFTVCDEAHKILDIIQGSYSPRFSDKTHEKIEKLVNFFTSHHVADLHSELSSIKRHIGFLKDEENQDTLLGYIARIALDLDHFKDPISLLKKRVASEYKKKPPKEWRQALWISDWIGDFKSKLVDYVDIISKTSTRNLVKNPNIDEIVFNCLEEKYLMHKYFHAHTGFRILMSATFSDPTEYLKGIALKGAKYIKLESQFNFEKSPIYFYNSHRMSYKHIESNLPWLINKVNTIISNHKGESGLIHSASYDLSMKIFNGLSAENRKRVLIYSGTEEKRNFLEDLKKSKDKVIIGPSLLEGLDLADDFGRFMIFAKTPYPSLADRFVKTKMKINPDWYSWKTCLSFCQGVGRIIRNENDWGITYMLDASFGDLIHFNRKMFPKEVLSRIRVIKEL
jgi:ATP-dependent DNA helicase DinG